MSIGAERSGLASNFTLWHYTAADRPVLRAGYFDPAAEMLRRNDLMIVNQDTDGGPSTRFCIVTDNDGTNVSVEPYA